MLCPRCANPTHNTRFCRHCGLELQKTETPIPTLAEAGGALTANLRAVPTRRVEPLDTLVGRTLDQRYYLKSELGAGGMGVLYRARRLSIGDDVVVKVLQSDLVGDSLAVERFRREAQTAAQLKHPNITAIYDFGVSDEGLVYLVMELVEGENL